MAFDIKNLDVSGEDYVGGLMNLNGGSGGSSGGAGMGSAMQGIFGTLQGLTMLGDGLDMIKDGANFQAGIYRESGKAAVEGSKFQASAYRNAGAASLVVANYNIAVDEIQTQRQQDALGRQLSDVMSSNSAITAANGISINSRSTMAVQNNIMTTAERTFVQTRNDATQRQSLITYQGKLSEMSYENQARAAEYSGLVQQQEAENRARSAEYQGKIDAYKQKNAAIDQIGGSISGMFQAFGGF